jgi:hypothetical protein
MLTTGLASVEACLLTRKRKTSHNRHRGACLRGALFRSAKTAPDRDEPGRGVDTNVMAPFWLINTRPLGQAPVVRKVAILSPLSPECSAKKGIYCMLLTVEYLGERVG